MIPYFELPALDLPFGQRIDVFGVLSAAGVVLGAWLAERATRTYAPGHIGPLRESVPWMVIFGLFGGHFMHVFAYHPELLKASDPFLVLRFWEGLSSMGGVLGALIGLFVFFRRVGQPISPWLDALALGTAPGWMVARIGCFLVHDHPGVRTDFPLAVDFPVRTYGGPRHDLGLYDVFVLAAISLVLYALRGRRLPQGRLMGVLAVSYTIPRFFLDFLRASDLSFVDRRYAGLTPAQYIVIGLFGVGVWLLTREAPPTQGVQKAD